MRRGSGEWTLLLLLLAGVVIGSFAGEWLGANETLSWLSYGKTFGITSPAVLDLSVIVLTFGLTIKFNIASIIGIIVAFIIYRKL